MRYPGTLVWPFAVAAALAVACTGVGLGTDRFDAAHPEPTQLMYALDADTAHAFWASQQTRPTGCEAQPADLPPPALTIVSSTTQGTVRTVTFTVRSLRAARLIDVDAPGITVRTATVHAGNASRTLPVAEHGFSLLFHAPPANGITVTLELDDTGPATLRVMDGSDGLAGLPGFIPRPAGVGVQGSHTSELVLVAHSVTV